MLREALTFEQLAVMAPDEAAALFVARRAEGLTPSEQALLDDWQSDPDHARALAVAERAWAAFADAANDELLAAMRAHALTAPARRWGGWRQWGAVAALLLVAVMSGLLFVPRPTAPGGNGGGGGVQIAAAGAIQYVSARGQVRDVRLPDGSAMTLDADSAVEARFGMDGRAVRLVRGRALFDVKHDPSRPFSVAALDRRIVDVGTRFMVSRDAGTLMVGLLQGEVRIESAGQGGTPVTLAPGERFLVRDGTASVGRFDASVTPNWHKGLLDFDGVPLGEAAAQINRYSTVQILVRDPVVRAMTVSGQFRAGDAARFAETVAEIHPIRVVRRGNVIELVRKK